MKFDHDITVVLYVKKLRDLAGRMGGVYIRPEALISRKRSTGGKNMPELRSGNVNARRNNKHIAVWVLPEEMTVITANARVAGLSVSEYLRKLGLNAAIKPKIDPELGREIIQQAGVLSKLGGLLKMLLSNEERFKGVRGAELQKQTESLLNEMKQAKIKLMDFVIN